MKHVLGHVQKRLTAALNNLKETKKLDDNGKKIVWSGKGRLTKKMFKHCKSTTEGLFALILEIAIFRHCSSTDENPHHEYCPLGGIMILRKTGASTRMLLLQMRNHYLIMLH